MKLEGPHYFLAILALGALLAAALVLLEPPGQPILGEVHEHADFKLFLNRVELDFSRARYMSGEPSTGSKTRSLSNFVHLHGMDGGVAHKHIAGVTLGQFFQTLGISFNSSCFVDDEGRQYCNGAGGALKMFVNGKPSNEFGEYEFHDLDRILVSFGNESGGELREQLALVSDRACVQSLKCPERGLPSNESGCVGSAGCAA